MSIDISRHPNDIFADLISQRNPNVPNLTKEDISIRRITDLNEYDYVSTIVTGNTKRPLTNYPAVEGMELPETVSTDYVSWLARKWMYFDGNDVTVDVKADDYTRVYLDGIEVAEVGPSTAEAITTFAVSEGWHDVMVVVRDGFGLTYAVLHITDGTNSYVSDESWLGTIVETDSRADIDVEKHLRFTLDTSIEVDLIGGVSESYGDFVKFTYGRIPVYSLFDISDIDKATRLAEVNYPIDNISMLSGAINNFQEIYENWYRFSHNTSGVYPAKENETLAWSYIAEYDCIQSTSNATTYIGFISDDFTDDYIFNTVMTSDQHDDDNISIILAAFKQGDIDDKEHTLSLRTHRGGFNFGYITLIEDAYQPGGSRTITTLDPSRAEKINNGVGWTDTYTHVYAKRVGSLIDIYVVQGDLPVDETKTRDEIIQSLVDDLSRLTTAGMSAQNYFYYQLDLAVDAPDFNRSVRYGYGQYSQANSRFWNIRRPNDNPEVTEELKQYFLSNFGWNVGDDGISVENIGANKFKVSFDNSVYKGELELRPE